MVAHIALITTLPGSGMTDLFNSVLVLHSTVFAVTSHVHIVLTSLDDPIQSPSAVLSRCKRRRITNRLHLRGAHQVLHITDPIGTTQSAVLPFVIMDRASGSKRAAGDEHGSEIDTEVGERASV